MRGATIAAILAGAAAAQTVSDSARLPEAGVEYGSLPCAVEPVKPALNFSFRFQAGYVFRVPFNLYQGGGHHWQVGFEVTPDSGNRRPVYFTDWMNLPAARPEAIGEVRSAFLLGEGRYHVKWSLLDDLGRVCRKEWDVEARAGRNERVTMPPDTAGDLAWRPAAESEKAGGYPRRLTVLLNAALPASVHQPEGRWARLVSMVSALVERLPGTAVRMVVFNLDQQRELFRQDAFTLAGMNQVSHAADGLAQWAVDYHVLQNPGGAWRLLADLVNGETHAADRPDAVVFLGLPWGTPEKIAADFPGAGHDDAPRFFYLSARAAARLPEAPTVADGIQSYNRGTRQGAIHRIPAMAPRDQPDAIEQCLRRLKGKTLGIYTPADFSKAIGEIERK